MCSSDLTARLDAQNQIAWDFLPLSRRSGRGVGVRASRRAWRPFTEIVIDEIQDISPKVEVARLLVAPEGGRIFGLGDPEQVLYGRPIKLALDQVTPSRHNRRWLARDYRSTRQRWRLAERWRVVERDTETMREAEVAPDRIGPAPRLVVEGDQSAALAALVTRVVDAATSSNPGMVGVLHLGAEIGASIVNALQQQHVSAVAVDGNADVRYGGPSVKVVSMRRSKGLDFPSLFILLPERRDASRDVITWVDRELSLEARRVLYVAATRASRQLVLVTSINAPHPLLEELDHSSYRVEGTRGGEWRRRVGGEDATDPVAEVGPPPSGSDPSPPNTGASA